MGFFDHFHKDGTAALKPQAPRIRKEVVKSASSPTSSSISPVPKHRRSPASLNPRSSDAYLQDAVDSRKSITDRKQERPRRIRKRASPLQHRLVSSSDSSDSGEVEIQPLKRIKNDRLEGKGLVRSLHCKAALAKDDDGKFAFLHAADIA